MHNLIKYKLDTADISYKLLTVNMWDSNNKSCQHRDFLRLDKYVETETLRDQEIWRVSGPRPLKTEQKLLRPRPLIPVLFGPFNLSLKFVEDPIIPIHWGCHPLGVIFILSNFQFWFDPPNLSLKFEKDLISSCWDIPFLIFFVPLPFEVFFHWSLLFTGCHLHFNNSIPSLVLVVTFSLTKSLSQVI